MGEGIGRGVPGEEGSRKRRSQGTRVLGGGGPGRRMQEGGAPREVDFGARSRGKHPAGEEITISKYSTNCCVSAYVPKLKYVAPQISIAVCQLK